MIFFCNIFSYLMKLFESTFLRFISLLLLLFLFIIAIVYRRLQLMYCVNLSGNALFLIDYKVNFSKNIYLKSFCSMHSSVDVTNFSQFKTSTKNEYLSVVLFIFVLFYNAPYLYHRHCISSPYTRCMEFVNMPSAFFVPIFSSLYIVFVFLDADDIARDLCSVQGVNVLFLGFV